MTTLTTKKNQPGDYTVTAASGRTYNIVSVEVYTEGAETGGWHLFEALGLGMTEWYQTFATKADAVAAVESIEATPAVTIK